MATVKTTKQLRKELKEMRAERECQKELKTLTTLNDAYHIIRLTSGDEDEVRYAKEQISLNEACIKSLSD